MDDKITLNRRSFLTGAAATGALAAAGALFGCAPTQNASNDAASAEQSAQGTVDGYSSVIDWLGPKPEIDEADIVQTVDTEILVLGGGNAGIQCALAAAEGGAKVDVVEKATEDARKVKGEDIGHCNSKFLIDQGYGPYDVGEIVEEFCIRCGGRVRPEILRKYVANSGEAVDHMMDLVQWPDDRIKLCATTIEPDVSPCDPSQVICQVPGIALDGYTDWPMKRGGYRSWPGTAMFMGTIRHDIDEENGNGVGAFSRLDEVQQFSILKGQELGATWHFNETATVLVQDEQGAVTGAITEGPDGYVKYNASKAVVLATGDYSQNADMLWGLQDELVEWAMRAGKTKEDLVGMSPNMGEGIKMACWAGGFVEASPRATNQNGSGANGPWGVCPMLWLNANGDRFMNEASVQQNFPEIIRQPKGLIAAITDANWAESVKNGAPDHGSPNFGRVEYFTELQEDMEKVELDNPEGTECRTMCIAERTHKVVYGSETLEGLLGILGYEGEALENALASIERYNELCHAGIDSDFGKDAECMIPVETPPFYASTAQNQRWLNVGLGTMGGLETDDDMNVTDKDGNPIPGLYAIGRCLGGTFGFSNPNPWAGKNIGSAVTLGRVCGKLLTGQDIQ
ncbi:FAD-binding protein [Rubneribacter badeniensis]|uniref:FAD-binding protein n=1 Tax=Rubneribacter badeniensis TaxID=2070688 RepID=UPI003A95C3B4